MSSKIDRGIPASYGAISRQGFIDRDTRAQCPSNRLWVQVMAIQRASFVVRTESATPPLAVTQERGSG
jgi:hypothetical protein